MKERGFLKFATLFEGALLLLAFGFGSLAGIDPLGSLGFGSAGWLYGMAGTLPLVLLFHLIYKSGAAGLYEIRRALIEKLGPFLAACGVGELLYLGFLAGITEEVLFRGFFQPWFEANWGWLGGLVFSNLVFALVHWVSPLYALLAGLTGVYLGLSLDSAGERNLLVPILIHSLYDVVAFLAVAMSYRTGSAGGFR
ncbi:MAG: CPBP family intramembrane metalloprotease [Methylococcus sp.]|nr:CPBP family intramembrane metalloprotease [Methylococcus sp.]